MSSDIQVFLDCDGVLADFDRGYEAVSGERPSRELDNVDWSLIALHHAFYRRLQPMPDAHELVDGVHALGFNPTVLTGTPWSVPHAAEDKCAWVAEHFPGVPIITCRSRDKYKHGKPRDVLIDDWPKYKENWTQMGGVWITHRSARQSLEGLSAYLENR